MYTEVMRQVTDVGEFTSCTLSINFPLTQARDWDAAVTYPPIHDRPRPTHLGNYKVY